MMPFSERIKPVPEVVAPSAAKILTIPLFRSRGIFLSSFRTISVLVSMENKLLFILVSPLQGDLEVGISSNLYNDQALRFKRKSEFNRCLIGKWLGVD